MSDYEFIEYDFDDPSLLEKYVGLPLLRLVGDRFYYRPFLRKISFGTTDSVRRNRRRDSAAAWKIPRVRMPTSCMSIYAQSTQT